MQPAVGEQFEQRRLSCAVRLYAVRDRNSHSRRTRFSLPAHILLILLRWVKMINAARLAQKPSKGRVAGLENVDGSEQSHAGEHGCKPDIAAQYQDEQPGDEQRQDKP